MLGLCCVVLSWTSLFMSNVSLSVNGAEYLYVPTGSNYYDLIGLIDKKSCCKNKRLFRIASTIKRFSRVKPGRYRLVNGMNYNLLINHLRLGLQEPVELSLIGIHTKGQLAGRLGRKLEIDSLAIEKWLREDKYWMNYKYLNVENRLCFFIPKIYTVDWNIQLNELLHQMDREYNKVWTKERFQKASRLNLTIPEVIILASIVESEQTRFDDEKPIIAGLYLNRLKKNMFLQSDPTVVYATGNFALNRVLNVDKQIDSPYNTYLSKGLPPGPICLPEISSIDAVLNPRSHEYLYMCAKDDFSGKHNFASSLEMHNHYAKLYRKALDKHNIRR